MKKVFALTLLALTLSTAPIFAEDHHTGHGKMFEKFDVDGDGSITKEEFLKRHEERFTKVDSNSDGTLSKDEVEAMKAEMKEMRKKLGTVEGEDENEDENDMDEKAESTTTDVAPTEPAPVEGVEPAKTE